jgi:hypothetical protein
MNPDSDLLWVVGALVVVLLLARELWCWFLKLNRIVALLGETNQLLLTLCELQKKAVEALPVRPSPTSHRDSIDSSPGHPAQGPPEGR